MLRFKILTSVVPFLAAAVLARTGLGPAPQACIALSETPVELASVPWTASLHVAFTDDPARATVRVQITDDPDAADFALVDDGATSEAGACQSSAPPRYVTISARPTADSPVIYLSSEGPADYRIYVRSKIFSAADAAALIVGAGGTGRRIQAAAL